MDVTPKIKQQRSIDDARKIGKNVYKWCNVEIIRKRAPIGANIQNIFSFYFGSICFLQFETLDLMLRPSVLLPNLLANIKPRKNKKWFILKSIWEIKTVLLLTLLRKFNNVLSVLILGKHLRLDHSLTFWCIIFSQPEKSWKFFFCWSSLGGHLLWPPSIVYISIICTHIFYRLHLYI